MSNPSMSEQKAFNRYWATRDQSRMPTAGEAFGAGYAAAQKENEARELHHFEAEQALANIKAYLDSGDFDEHDDTEQRDNILDLIPKDI